MDRQRLMGLVCSCCTPDVAASIMQDWLMEEAVLVAQERLARQEAACIQVTESNLALTARAANDALIDTLLDDTSEEDLALQYDGEPHLPAAHWKRVNGWMVMRRQ